MLLGFWDYFFLRPHWPAPEVILSWEDLSWDFQAQRDINIVSGWKILRYQEMPTFPYIFGVFYLLLNSI